MSLYQKIAQARFEFSQNKNIKKSGFNSGFKYYYFELSDILPTCIDICNKLKIAPVVSFEDGYATMTVYDAESSDIVVIKSPLEEASVKGGQPIQNLGAIETYSRRYLWFSLFEITEHDAIDSAYTDDMPTNAKAPKESKINKNDSKVIGVEEKDYSAVTVWTKLMEHFGYLREQPESMESLKAKEKSLEFIKPYGYSSGREITPDKGKIILERIERIENLPPEKIAE